MKPIWLHGRSLVALQAAGSSRDIAPPARAAMQVAAASDRSTLAALTWRSLLALVVAFAAKSIVGLDSVASFAGFSLLTLPKIAGACFLVLLAAHMARAPREYALEAASRLPLLALLVLACVSTVTAMVPATAFITTCRYAAYIAFFIGVAGLADDAGRRRQLVIVLTVGCAIAATFALADLATHRKILATTPFGDANDVALLLASTWPLAIWLASTARRLRVAAWAAVVAIGLAIPLTMSRGALLALAAAAAWLLMVERRSVRMIVASAAALVAVALFVIAVNPAPLRVGLAAKERIASANVQNRLEAWRFAADRVVEHPLLGIGPGNFGAAYESHWRANPGLHHLSVVHNSWLEIATELGVPAFAAFVAFYALAFARMGRPSLPAPGDEGLALPLRLSMLIAAVAGFFVSVELTSTFWLLAGLATAVAREPSP
ncbi:MAG TPA: O-antigen ligase family protein [Casimicrobiaceae bacterium]|jgi:O-antigen ligase|nr:O-antigen ligase family protein [Casimicrobiaceae bacterium]